MRALIEIAGGETGKASALARHFLEVRGRNELGLWRAAQFHERAEEVLDALVFRQWFDLIQLVIFPL